MNIVNLYKYGILIIKTPANWRNVTDEIEAQSPPFTLARNEGNGALQFTVAAYKDGDFPAISNQELKKLLVDFQESRELGRSYDFAEHKDGLLICANSFDSGENFLRVWYCSDSLNIALVTYVCKKGHEGDELKDCEQIVGGLKFEG